MSEVVAHYQKFSEAGRLESDRGPLELARTQELIVRHLAPPPGVVLDVGGGVGVYAAWLGSLGYEAHLIDLTPRHIEEARGLGSTIASVTVGDARRIERPEASADAVLLLGPLYHLTDRHERVTALREVRRMLRPGGLLFAAAICRFAPLLDSLMRGFVDDPRFAPILERSLAEGQHRNTTENPDYFTTAFFHRPEELRAEIAESGITLIDLVAVEGPGWLAPDFAERWNDPARRTRLLELVRTVEHEEALFGVSMHLLAVARKE
jgi:SAM-dependent methyltransferase